MLLNPKTKFLSLPSNIPAVALGGTAVTRKRVVSRVVWWLLIVFVLFSSISVKAQSDRSDSGRLSRRCRFFRSMLICCPRAK